MLKSSSLFHSDDDMLSTTTSVSVGDTISVISTELSRQKERINFIHKRFDPDLLGRLSSNTLTGPCSIMIVRTLHESINGGASVLVKKKRRRLRLKFTIERSTSTSLRINKCSSLKRSIIVQFSLVTIREYHVIPGDNPSVSAGPPLTLDWEPANTFSIDIKIFEEYRYGRRRHKLQMIMPPDVRVSFLLEQEHTIHSIVRATNDAASIRENRLQTLASLEKVQAKENIPNIGILIRRFIMKPFR